MSWKGQPRCDAIVGTDVVVDRRVLTSNRKLGSNLQSTIVRDLAHVPCCKARWVSIILPLARVASPVKISMEVEFFSWIVLMYILAVTFQVVYTVLNAENTTSIGIFSNSNRVAKSPTEDSSSRCKVEGACV